MIGINCIITKRFTVGICKKHGIIICHISHWQVVLRTIQNEIPIFFPSDSIKFSTRHFVNSKRIIIIQFYPHPAIAQQDICPVRRDTHHSRPKGIDRYHRHLDRVNCQDARIFAGILHTFHLGIRARPQKRQSENGAVLHK